MTQQDVMIVDDNPANLGLLEEMLAGHNLGVRSFPLARLALAAAAQNPPDLILLDINMPEMTGYEMCKRLKSDSRLSGIPVIFLSALNGPEDRLQCFRSGGVDYVSKPFQVEEVHARVDTHLRLRYMQQLMASDNTRLQEMVQAQVKQIADAHIETIFAIAKLAETRDGETGRHLERIQVFCRLLAEGLSRKANYEPKINDLWIRNIFHASPLHDIGKVGIPDRILLKPGSLTTPEIEIMQTHTTMGAQTLRKVQEHYPDNEFIEMGIRVAESHHERWDGTGYPRGIAGESIPLCARIVALADCYDALRSHRRYKPSVSHDEAYQIILRESGRHFDPELTALFRDLADVFEKEWDKASIETD